MIEVDKLKSSYNTSLNFEKVNTNMYRIIAPYFHDDGDSIDIFIKEDNDRLIITDYGMSLMKLSYMFDIDTESKKDVLNNILIYNNLENKDGELTKETTFESFNEDLNQFYLAIAKITNMEILSKNLITSMFNEILDDYFEKHIKEKYDFVRNFKPLPDSDITIDYKIEVKGLNIPLFVFPIKTSIQAVRMAYDCAEMKGKVKSVNIAVCEDMSKIDKKDFRRMNAQSLKCYSDFKEFEDSIDDTINNVIDIANCGR